MSEISYDGNCDEISSNIVKMLPNNSVSSLKQVKKEQRVEKKFQKIMSAEVDNIDKSVESFDQSFDMIVHDDEISSLQQDFSKISWNESVSANTSTIADIEQSTPDNDVQDFLTDTGGEFMQQEISEELQNETKISPDSHSPPQPTPRTGLAVSKEEVSERFEEKIVQEEKGRQEMPVPLPRRQQITESTVVQDSEELKALDISDPKDTLVHEKDDLSDSKDTTVHTKEVSFLSEEIISSTKDDTVIDQTISISEPDLPLSTATTYQSDQVQFLDQEVVSVEPVQMLNGSGSFEMSGSVTSYSEDSNKIFMATKPDISTPLDKSDIQFDVKQESTQDDDLPSEKIDYTISSLEPSLDINLKRSPSLSKIQSKLVAMDSFEDVKSEMSMEKQDDDDDDEQGIGFYIGESSSNLIVKSKSPQFGEEKDENEVSLLKDESFSEDNEKEPSSSELKIAAHETVEEDSNSISVDKVVRQSSETRNDLLEAEIESQKLNLEVKSLPATITSSEEEKDSTKEPDLEKVTQPADETEISYQTKISKLDLLLDKSELELSEKSSALPMNAKKKTDITEILKAESSLPDELLVERTLEEVKLSLDAAKEELIQVVRDGKAIKQSPSEFEFKNISHAKLNLDQEESCLTPGTMTLGDIQETNDIPSDNDEDEEKMVEKDSEKAADLQQQALEKPLSPVNNRWSLHDVDNSSSSESYYKSTSRPCSSDFDTVQTFHTSSEYQTAMDASVCRGSTEYVSAVGTLQSSGNTINSHESMKSLSSEASGNLGSIDTSDLSETLIASIGDQDIDIDIENEDFDALEEDIGIQMHEHQIEFESKQSCMKRSQEMIFTKEEILATPEIPIPSPKLEEGSTDETRVVASSLEESSILSMSSTSAVDTVVNNFEDLIGSAGSSSLAGIEMFTSVNEYDPVVHSPVDSHDTQFETEADPSDKPTNADEPRRRGHKRSESTLVSTDLIKNLLDEDVESTSPDDIDKRSIGSSSNLFGGGDEGSESDQDPYESEYSRAFKSPTQRKKRKEKKPAEALEQGQENVLGSLHLATQTIIEDSLTEELESLILAEEERRPSQNMQDYSKIPDITVTEEISKYSVDDETDDFPDNSLYKVKTQDELNKVEDTPIQRAGESSYSITEEQFNVLVQQQYKQKLADLNDSQDIESRGPDSPDSFEMVDQPDITDEFVIIEEVAKEASEFDVEGKSIKISSSKVIKKHDEEVEQILIKSAPAATNLGSQIFRDDLNFEFEESPPSAQAQLDSEAESAEAANKKWVEMQLSDHAAQLRYPYELERGVLEDIKEEDAEFEVGSSRISSFKDSFSSTPDYDVLAGRKYFSKAEHDDISMSSLQEFESLEQAISLENRRIYQGSTDSSNGSFTRRYTIKNACGDDISLSSLKEFEGLENACIEAHLIEIKAKEEAALLLSRSDESNKSNNGGESTQNVVVTKLKTITTQSIPKETIEAILKSKLEECESSRLMETSLDSLEVEAEAARRKLEYEASEHGSADSLECNKSADFVTSSIDSFDVSKELTTKSDVDSLEAISNKVYREESIDSIDLEQMASLSHLESDLDTVANVSVSTTTESSFYGPSIQSITTKTVTTSSILLESPGRISKEMSNDSLNFCVEQTDSAATNATYYNEGTSLMSVSDSITSLGSSTIIDDSSIPMAAQQHQHQQQQQKFTLPLHCENISLDEESHPAHSKVLEDKNDKQTQKKL